MPFHPGEIGVGYAPVALGATGGTPPYKWSIASGALPPGLKLTSGGTASGQPTATGAYSFVVRVDDSAGDAAGVPRSITVVPHLVVFGTCANQCRVEDGCVTVCGNYGTQSGGVGPFKYAVIVGQIPTGMGLRGLNLTGAFTQAPPNNSCECNPAWSFSVTVTDALGATDGLNAIYDVYRHIHLYPNGSCIGTSPGSGCSVILNFYYGDNTGQLATNSASSGAPPYSAQVSGNAITLTFPANGPAWNGSVDLAVHDQSPCGPGTLCKSNTVTVPVSVT